MEIKKTFKMRDLHFKICNLQINTLINMECDEFFKRLAIILSCNLVNLLTGQPEWITLTNLRVMPLTGQPQGIAPTNRLIIGEK